jgi:hypothetical protein
MTVPREPPSLDELLSILQQLFADVGVIIGVRAELQRNADRLLTPLAGELRRIRGLIDDVLTRLP